MSYRLYIKSNDKLGVDWWAKSLEPIMEKVWARKNQNPTGKAFYSQYAASYNVKLKFDEFGYLDYIEFPNEGEAMMFVLKWM